MSVKYPKILKKQLCTDICLNGKSTIKTADDYGIPIKTLEKWITAFNKDCHCFDSNDNPNDFKSLSNITSNPLYNDLSIDELKKILLKKDIEIARLKKNYLVTKQDGTEKKVFVSFSKKNTK